VDDLDAKPSVVSIEDAARSDLGLNIAFRARDHQDWIGKDVGRRRILRMARNADGAVFGLCEAG
jgi:hypothetical protein